MDKEAIRKMIQSKRLELSSDECRLRSRAIQTRLFNREEFRRSKAIQFYISFDNEVETREMIGRALEMGKRVLVPYLAEDQNLIGLSEIKDIKLELKKNKNGFEEPYADFIRPFEPSLVELWLIPGVAFDPSGNRIGYGKGFYDRLLGHRGTGILAGLAFDFQMVKSIPVEPHDVKMNRIITEYRTIEAS